MPSFVQRLLSSAGVLFLTLGALLLLTAGAVATSPPEEVAGGGTTVTVLPQAMPDAAEPTVAPSPTPSAGVRAWTDVVLSDTATSVRPAPEPSVEPSPSPQPSPQPEAQPSHDPASHDPARTRRTAGTTLLAAAGTSRDPVDTGGSTVRFSVEVEAATGLDPDAVAAIVEEALYDGRSWAVDRDLQRVAPDEASLHVVVATPATVDRICARAGLNTAGWLSCWSRDTAAINLDRWMTGTAEHTDIDLYRHYVVNHEVGHGLGHGHTDCPGPGALAPVMQQQTKGLDGCRPNPWPYP